MISIEIDDDSNDTIKFADLTVLENSAGIYSTDTVDLRQNC